MNDGISAILDGIVKLNTQALSCKQSSPARTVDLPMVLGALNCFGDCVRYLNTRRSSGALLKLENESAVQDVLYLMLRPWIRDLVPENPTDRIANRYSIKDFYSPSTRIVIEAKYVRNNEHGKGIVKELNDDIETYRYHAGCDDLVFFIYDPDGCIPDGAALERHLCSARSYGERALRCHAVIKP